jgi:Holliday junction resolvasome RuvABC endonuclease subunit
MKHIKPERAPISLNLPPTAGVVALDLSLTRTGVAARIDLGIGYWSITSDRRGMERLTEICARCALATADADLVVMEGLSMGKALPSALERAGLAYLIRMALWRRNAPVVLVPPSTLKKFTTGSGLAEKAQMLKVVFQRWGHDCLTDDEADACALLHYGLQLIGAEQPANEAQREALTKCELVARGES